MVLCGIPSWTGSCTWSTGRVRRQRRRRVGCGRLTGYLAPADKAQEGQSSDDRDTKEKEVEDDAMQRMAKVQHEGSETLAKAVENRLGQGPQDIEAEVDENTPLSNIVSALRLVESFGRFEANHAPCTFVANFSFRAVTICRACSCTQCSDLDCILLYKAHIWARPV